MRSVLNRLALLTGAVAVLAAAAVASAEPARAAGSCPPGVAWSGDRLCYYVPGTGNVQWTVMHIFTGTDGHDRAAGEAYGILGSTVSFDISRDGGRTYSSGHDAGTQDGPGFYDRLYTTDAVYDGPGYWVRACATSGQGDRDCTGWN